MNDMNPTELLASRAALRAQPAEPEIIRTPTRRMAIRNLVPRLPERGKIKIGIKGEARTSQYNKEFQPPQKLDHFRITTLQRGRDGNFLVDQEMHNRLGERPTEIPVRLLYDDTTLNFQTRYACFIGKTLWCSGDGESAVRISENPPRNRQEVEQLKPSPREVSCTCFRQAPTYQGHDRCKMNGNLSVIIDNASGLGGVWNFRTTSYNTIVGLLSSLEFIRQVTGGILSNIPLKLRLQPKQAIAPTDGSQVLIYVVSVEFAGTIDELQRLGHQIALARATAHVSIAQIEDEARRRLAYAPLDTALPGDDNGDIVDEFYPEQVSEAEAPAAPTREQFASEPSPAERNEPLDGAGASPIELGVAAAETYELTDCDGVVTQESDPDKAEALLCDILSEAFRRTMALPKSQENPFTAALENNHDAIAALSIPYDDGSTSEVVVVIEDAKETLAARPDITPPPNGRRGRPPGSRNKPKEQASPVIGTGEVSVETGPRDIHVVDSQNPDQSFPTSDPERPPSAAVVSPAPVEAANPQDGIPSWVNEPEQREEVVPHERGTLSRELPDNATPPVVEAGGFDVVVPFVPGGNLIDWYAAARNKLVAMQREQVSPRTFAEYETANEVGLREIREKYRSWAAPIDKLIADGKAG